VAQTIPFDTIAVPSSSSHLVATVGSNCNVTVDFEGFVRASMYVLSNAGTAGSQQAIGFKLSYLTQALLPIIGFSDYMFYGGQLQANSISQVLRVHPGTIISPVFYTGSAGAGIYDELGAYGRKSLERFTVELL
jgi:hypothetical protein